MEQLEKVEDMIQSSPNQSQTRHSEYLRVIILVFSLKRPPSKLMIKRLLKLKEAAVGERLFCLRLILGGIVAVDLVATTMMTLSMLDL